MKVFITGHKSMVAQHIKRCANPEWEIYPDDKVRYDLRDTASTLVVLNAFKPDVVIHTAGKVGSMIDNMNAKYDYMYENMMINMNVINSCKTLRIPKLLAISSTCAYPDALGDYAYPLAESRIHEGPPTDTSIGYAYSKRMMQLSIDLCNEQYGTEYNYIIPSNIYSEFDKHKDDRMHFLTRLLYNIYQAEINEQSEVVMQGSGDVYRQYLYGDDIGRAVRLHIDGNLNESYNLAGKNRSLEDLGTLTLDALGLTDRKRLVFANKIPAGQVRKDVANYKFLKLFPDFVFTSFRDKVPAVYEELRKKWQSS